MKYRFTIYLLLSCMAGAIAQSGFLTFKLGSAIQVTNSVAIPVTSQNFSQIMACQGSIQWNATVLTLDSVASVANALAGIQFTDSVIANTGSLSYIWVDNALSGQTLANHTVLFVLYFKAVAGATGETNLQFSSSPTAQLAVHNSGSTINNAIYENGLVQLAAVPETPQLIVQSVTSFNQPTVSIPITASALQNIIGFQGSLVWDSTVFSFASITNVHPTLVGFESQFVAGTSLHGPAVSFLWLDANFVARSFPSNTVLFTLVLQVHALFPQTSVVGFSNTPTFSQVIAANGTSINNIYVQNGYIGVAGGSAPAELRLGSSLFLADTTVTIPITVQNFRNITALQGSIQWNNEKMAFAEVVSVSPAFSGLQVNNTVINGIGRLSYLWASDDASSRSISNNSTLFSIRFRVPAGTTGFTHLAFGNSPTPQMLAGLVSVLVDRATYQSGLVTFSNRICVGGNASITSNQLGASYQWQIDSGLGYQNLSNSANYQGVQTATLSVAQIPGRLGGAKLKCLVGMEQSEPYQIQFSNYWLGGTSTNWHLPINWSCNLVPDENTNVVISSAIQNPNVSQNIRIKSLQIASGYTLQVADGVQIILTGK